MGSIAAKLCRPGTYADTTGNWACTPCPAGTYGGSLGLDSNLCSGLCPSGPGSYCPMGSADGSTLCPVGSYCIGGINAPSPCPHLSLGGVPVGCPYTGLSAELAVVCNSVDPNGLGTDCASCPGGYYCATSAAKLQCPADYFCPAWSFQPSPCPQNTYSEVGSDNWRCDC